LQPTGPFRVKKPVELCQSEGGWRERTGKGSLVAKTKTLVPVGGGGTASARVETSGGKNGLEKKSSLEKGGGGVDFDWKNAKNNEKKATQQGSLGGKVRERRQRKKGKKRTRRLRKRTLKPLEDETQGGRLEKGQGREDRSQRQIRIPEQINASPAVKDRIVVEFAKKNERSGIGRGDLRFHRKASKKKRQRHKGKA